jgi:hypothetical protein
MKVSGSEPVNSNSAGQSLGDLHSIDVNIAAPSNKPATSSIMKKRKTNRIIAGANLIVLSIFFLFLYITKRISFYQFIVYKAHQMLKQINILALN